MRYVISAGCDGATLCAFDPAALPPDADTRLVHDPLGRMEAWQAEGRFWVGGTGSDGRSVFHVYVDQPLPEPEPGETRTLEARFDHFPCPSGRLWLCGAEYVARDPGAGSPATPAGGLDRSSTQGGYVPVPAGDHQIWIYRTERPEPGDVRALSQVLRAARDAGLRSAVAVALVVLGGLAAASAGLVLIVSLPIKVFQWATEDPLFSKGWHVAPIALGILVAGAAAVVLGRRIARLLPRSGAGSGDDPPPEPPDYVVRVTSGARR